MKHNLLWLDLEMTGLDPEQDVILQCAVLITTNTLEYAGGKNEYIIHQNSASLQRMNSVVKKMHTNSGLLEKVQKSPYNINDIETQLIAVFNEYCMPHETLLCGNSIWVDRSFLKKHMPQFEQLLHYRMIDVSTIKELVVRWYPHIPKFEKQKKHTALADIQESINELVYYKQHVFLP